MHLNDPSRMLNADIRALDICVGSLVCFVSGFVSGEWYHMVGIITHHTLSTQHCFLR